MLLGGGGVTGRKKTQQEAATPGNMGGWQVLSKDDEDGCTSFEMDASSPIVSGFKFPCLFVKSPCLILKHPEKPPCLIAV